MSDGSYDFTSDLWCLGVLMYVLLVGHYPFDGVCAEQVVIDTIMAKFEGSKLARSVVEGLLNLDAKQRLALADICPHEWLQDWKDGDLERQAKRQCIPTRTGADELLQIDAKAVPADKVTKM